MCLGTCLFEFIQLGVCWVQCSAIDWTDSGCEVLEGSKPVPGFPDGSVSKEPTCSAGAAADTGPIPGQGRCPGGGQGNPLQCSGWENPWTEELQSMGSQSWTWLKWPEAPMHINPSCLLLWVLSCGFHSCEMIPFQGDCWAGERELGIDQAKMSQNLLFLLRFSHFYWINAPWIAATLWLISKVLEKWFWPFLLVFLLPLWRSGLLMVLTLPFQKCFPCGILDVATGENADASIFAPATCF